MDSKNWIWWF